MLGALATTALARPQILITNDGFSNTPIHVVSENGTSWTKVEDRTIGLPVTIGIGKDDSVVRRYAVRQSGQPHGTYIFSKDYENASIRVDYKGTLTGSTTHLTADQREKMIALCNTNLNKGKGIHETHNMFGGVGVELIAWFVDSTGGIWKPLDAAEHGDKGFGQVPVPIVCEGKPATPGGYAAAEPKFSVKGIHLRFMTSAGYPTAPNPGTRCKLTQAKVRVETSKAGPVKFKLWTKVGSEAVQYQVVEAWSSFVGPGKFEASFTKPIPVSKSSSVQAMAEDMTNPIGQSTGWKAVNVKCTGAAGGGLADVPGLPNPDAKPRPVPPKRIIGGVMGDLTTGPRPTHHAPQTPRGPQFKTAPMSGGSGIAAKERFYRAKPHLN